MIKNIVFDLGGVLVDFKPQILLKHLGFNEIETTFYTNAIFYSEEWGKFNCSILDDKQVREEIINKNKVYEERINYIFDNLDYNYLLFERTKTSKFLESLKEKGYNIYLLSDLSKYSFEYNSSMSFFKNVKGGIYSFEVGTIKPDDNNYKRLLGDFNLVADETIFIDDHEENVQKAEEFGIHGVVYTTLEEVVEKVNKLLEG